MPASIEGPGKRSKMESFIYPEVRDYCRQMVQFGKNLSPLHPSPHFLLFNQSRKNGNQNLTQSCIKEALSLFASGEGSSIVCSISMVCSWIQNIYRCLHNTPKAGKKPFLARRATAATSQRWVRLEQVIFCHHDSTLFAFPTIHDISFLDMCPISQTPGHPEISQLTAQAH